MKIKGLIGKFQGLRSSLIEEKENSLIGVEDP